MNPSPAICSPTSSAYPQVPPSLPRPRPFRLLRTESTQRYNSQK